MESKIDTIGDFRDTDTGNTFHGSMEQTMNKDNPLHEDLTFGEVRLAGSTLSLEFGASEIMKDTTTEVVLPSPKDVEYTEKHNISTQNMEAINETVIVKKEPEELEKVVCFINQDAKVTPSPVLQYVLDIEQPFDTVISCADGKIGAHRLVLVTASPFLGDLLCSRDHRLGEVATLVLPDIPVSIMKVLLNFCYTGTVYFPEENEKEVLETMRLLLMGEFGKLSLKKVTIKAQPRADTPEESQPPDGEHEQNISVDINNDPGPSSAMDGISSMDDLLTSSSEDEEEECKDSSSEDNNEGENAPVKNENADERGEQERLAFANNFLRHKKDNSSNNNINYIIQKLPGSKMKKLMCYHCPGAFKSVETLTTHLDNNHGIDLQSRSLNHSEFKTLTYCSHCKTKHKNISSTNQCISKHSRTRCFLCLEIIRLKQFDDHIKKCHVTERRNGMSIVQCRWCEAGILMQDFIDNKSMSSHCFTNHFPGGKNVKIDADFTKEDKSVAVCEKKLNSPAGNSSSSNKHQVKVQTHPRASDKTSKIDIESSKHVNSKGGSVKASPKTVPAVLAMLQKASQKRKLLQESEGETEHQLDATLPIANPKKRVRLGENGKRLQVAKRTGIPVGRLVDLNSLIKGVPQMSSGSNKGKAKTLLIDVTRLPKIYVNFKYPKSFIFNHIRPENVSERKDGAIQDLSHNSQQCNSNTSDALTEKIENKIMETSDYRCSLPLPCL